MTTESTHPLGARRCAERLATQLPGLAVDGADVDELATRGLITKAGTYKDYPLYDVADIDRCALEHADLLTELVAEREAWMEASTWQADAGRRLGWSGPEVAWAAEQRGITKGRFGRYALADIEALAADEELAELVVGSRTLGPDLAAEMLEIRRTDFDYAEAAGWIRPASHAESKVGRRWVTIPLYRACDVAAPLDLPGVDWEEVRAVAPGRPSPLRQYATLPTPRGVLIRGLAADLSERHGTVVIAAYDGRTDNWTLQWTPGPAGELSAETVATALRDDPDLSTHQADIALQPLV